MLKNYPKDGENESGVGLYLPFFIVRIVQVCIL